MKRIAITQRIEVVSETKEMRDTLDVKWTEMLSQISYLAIPIPSHGDTHSFIVSAKPDGIILSGGNDLSSLNSSESSIIRDKLEKAVLDYAIWQNIPILGVCRGAQFINQYFGGEVSKTDGHVGNKHRIVPQESSRYSRFIEANSMVNSYHNHCIFSLPDSLECCAISEDGSIEAFNHKLLKVFGQMWHPEREVPFEEWNLDLVKYLFEKHKER